MKRPDDDRIRRRPRSSFRPESEALEVRQVLSTTSVSVAMDARADGMIGGMATNHVLVLGGHAAPGASVQVQVGSKTQRVVADGSGFYQSRMPLAPGSYPVAVRARDHSGHVSATSMSVTMGDAVLAWDAIMVATIKADVGNVGLGSRTMAMVSGAVYDAVNAVDQFGSTYHDALRAPAGASATAAASEAAYSVLSALDPAMRATLDRALAESVTAVGSASAWEGGARVGTEAAQSILAWRANDGSAASMSYVPGTQPGQWRPTPPTYQTAWGPEWGAVQTFGVTRPAAAFLPPPPPALDSPAYAAALNQVESIGALDSKTRTAYQTQTGLFWANDSLNTGTPPVQYEQIAASVALQRHNGIDQNARMFGLVNVAMGDAGITAWDTKYLNNRWRPITAIRLANTDGNPATQADPTWTPLNSPGAPGQPSFTPPFPSYVSGHATFGAALFTTLTDFYGTDKVHFTVASNQLVGVTRSYSSFSQASYENAISRVYLGVHFWFDESNGMTLGSSVARDVIHNVMTPRPA